VPFVKNRKRGVYADGGGLYFHVSGSGTKSWIYRFRLNQRSREMGLGPVHAISLSEARDRALQCRKMRHQGIDPIEARKAERQRARDKSLPEKSAIRAVDHHPALPFGELLALMQGRPGNRQRDPGVGICNRDRSVRAKCSKRMECNRSCRQIMDDTARPNERRPRASDASLRCRTYSD